MVIGLAAGIHLPSAIATITAEVQKADWGKALSIHQAAPPLSFVSAPLIAALLLNWFTWRYVLLSWAAIALASAAVFTFRGKGGQFPGQLPSPGNMRIILSNPSFYIMVLLFAMAMGGNAGIYAMLPLFFVNERGMDLTVANTVIGLSQVSGIVMVFVAGWVTDKIGQKPAMAAALAAAAIFTVLLGLLRGPILLVVLFVQPAVLSSFFPGSLWGTIADRPAGVAQRYQRPGASGSIHDRRRHTSSGDRLSGRNLFLCYGNYTGRLLYADGSRSGLFSAAWAV
jgi:NNP family nitrate/nitrite transporter-like MFS transporter